MVRIGIVPSILVACVVGTADFFCQGGFVLAYCFAILIGVFRRLEVNSIESHFRRSKIAEIIIVSLNDSC